MVEAVLADNATPNGLQAERAKIAHVPSMVEAAASQEQLAVIRKIFGSRAQTLINALLAFEAYFAWYFPFKKSIPYMCDMPLREARALDNCKKAIDMQESFERVSINNHGS